MPGKQGEPRRPEDSGYGIIECAWLLKHALAALWPDGGRPTLDPVVVIDFPCSSRLPALIRAVCNYVASALKGSEG